MFPFRQDLCCVCSNFFAVYGVIPATPPTWQRKFCDWLYGEARTPVLLWLFFVIKPNILFLDFLGLMVGFLLLDFPLNPQSVGWVVPFCVF